jgi:hypothetical protein
MSATIYLSFDAVSVEEPHVLDDEDDPVAALDGGVDWSGLPTVPIENAPYSAAFDTESFHRVEYVVTGVDEQQYAVDGDIETRVKPREELTAAQWALDNVPATLGHPRDANGHRGLLRDVRDVHGFWRGPSYDVSADKQYLTLYVPTNDEDAKRVVEATDAASVGITHRSADPEDYEGTVGGDVALDAVDTFQTDILYDHVALADNARFRSAGPTTAAMDSLDADVEVNGVSRRLGDDNGGDGDDNVADGGDDNSDADDDSIATDDAPNDDASEDEPTDGDGAEDGSDHTEHSNGERSDDGPITFNLNL